MDNWVKVMGYELNGQAASIHHNRTTDEWAVTHITNVRMGTGKAIRALGFEHASAIFSGCKEVMQEASA